MKLEQKFDDSSLSDVDLEEKVRIIIELWGEGESLNEDRIAEVAANLYNAKPEKVKEAIIKNLRNGLIKGEFYVPPKFSFKVKTETYKRYPSIVLHERDFDSE